MIKNSNINLLKNKYDENKLSHVFLIETNNQNFVLNDIIEFIKYINCEKKYKDNCKLCNLCNLIDKNILPNLKIIYPDGQAIKKEQMETLKNDFSHMPFISKYNVYIINEAEKLNQSSANAILKFIEEPEDNIIGFLITNNKDNIISTIKSRCDVFNAYYEKNDSILNINENLIENYIINIETNIKNSILINKIIVEKKLEKNEIVDFFKYMLNFYQNLLNENENKYKLELKDILKRINIIDDILDKLNYNVNINLLLDYFIISLEDA